MEEKHGTSMRFSGEARRLLTLLATRLGVSKSAIMEMAIRAFAEKEGNLMSHANPPETSQSLPAFFLGWQETLPGFPMLCLWTLTQEVLGHPAGSTVVTDTLRVAGYHVEEPMRHAR